ncbi:hypothetical protein [Microbulbifer magnicolonia]|uniref:hypothetical protein n=1 Tax=Microbulbifer magnicolonia TaxID=3109744 RepID=UPI002B403690|nr:hypothetical protein [Microbulbifer sp. GG15]
MMRPKENPRAVAAAGGFPSHFHQPKHYSPSAAPFDKVVATIADVRFIGKNKVRGRCPIHDGRSLEATEYDSGKVGLRCWGCGADYRDLCQALGLHVRDLFPHDPTWKPEPSRPRANLELREQLKLDEHLVFVFLDDPRHPLSADLNMVEQAINRLRKYDPGFFDRAMWVYRPGDEQFGRLYVEDRA